MISIVESPSKPMHLIGSNPFYSRTSVEGVGNESSFVQTQITVILDHWVKALTLVDSTDFRWIQSALELFPGISGLTATEAERYEQSLNELFTSKGKKTGRNFFQ